MSFNVRGISQRRKLETQLLKALWFQNKFSPARTVEVVDNYIVYGLGGLGADEKQAIKQCLSELKKENK